MCGCSACLSAIAYIDHFGNFDMVPFSMMDYQEAVTLNQLFFTSCTDKLQMVFHGDIRKGAAQRRHPNKYIELIKMAILPSGMDVIAV